MTAVAALLCAPRPAPAAPTGGTVVEGSAAISQSGSATNINQSTNRAIIDWRGFSVGANESVNFYQPTNLSVTLNRVIGNERSVIDGALNANGRVFLVNSAGVLFTKNATVNVGGLVASTFDISNSDFMAGNYSFSRTASRASSSTVDNRGNIHARDGGYVALLGRTVSNEGVITARLGSIALATGNKVTLNFGGDSLVDVTVDEGAYKALVDNKGVIQADGGRVIMTAKAADGVLSAQVNNSGVVRARTLADLTGAAASEGAVRIGQIKLLASNGRTRITGRLDASAPHGGDGGVIETRGHSVQIANRAVITTKAAKGQTGNWTIGKDGITVAASGGDMTGAMIAWRLTNNNITLSSTQANGSSGDIDVNAAVSWASGSTLTLDASGSINVNAPFKAESGALVMRAGWDINANAADAFAVRSLDANAVGHTLKISAAQNWTNVGQWTLSGANVVIDRPLSWSTDSTLTLKATTRIDDNGQSSGGMIRLNAPITGTGAASKLVVNADRDIEVNIANAFGADSLEVNALGRLDINAAQNWTTFSGQWSLTGGDVYVYDKIDWSGVTPLTIASTRSLNLFATIAGAFNYDAWNRGIWKSPSLVLNAGADLNLDAADVLAIDTQATAVGNVNIEASQSWSGGGSWTLAGANVNVKSPISLAFGNLTLRATQDVKITAPVDWWSGTVTFDAGANVFVNNVVTETLAGNLVMNHGSGVNADGSPNGIYMSLANPGGYSGRVDFYGWGQLTINGQGYTVINSVAGLDAVAGNRSGNYALGSSLANLGWSDLQPFMSAGFTGNFNGLGHTLALTPQASISFTTPVTIAELKNTNLQFASLGNIDISAPVTSGAGLLSLIADGDINLGASLTSGANSSASFVLSGDRIAINDSVGVTGGNIFIDAPLSWSQHTLTLAAKQFINLNAALTASGTARLVMSYAEGFNADGTPQGGLNAAYDSSKGAFVGKVNFVHDTASDALTINAHPYTLITSMAQLAAISDQSDAHFALARDLNAAGKGSNADGSYAGAVVANLASSLEGLGHTVSNLTINDMAGNGSNGLIGASNAGNLVSNIAVKNVKITGTAIVDAVGNLSVSANNGSLIGFNRGNVTNAYAFGVMVTSPGPAAGGLIGGNFKGLINNAHAYDVNVTANGNVGGLIGTNKALDGDNGIINDSSASGFVGQTQPIAPDDLRSAYGGLVGTNIGGTINRSIARVDVSFSQLNTTSQGNPAVFDGQNVGGLVGNNVSNSAQLAKIIDSAAYGKVSSLADNVGGLVGTNSGGLIIRSSAYGRVENTAPSRMDDGTPASEGGHPGAIGGLVGVSERVQVLIFPTFEFVDVGGDIINSNAYGDVYAPNATSVGGFAGTLGSGPNTAPVVVGSAAYGNVTGASSVGGFFGSNYGATLAFDAAFGNVVASGGQAGGFGGYNGNYSVIIHSTASGDVTAGGSRIGGFLGINAGIVADSSSSGTVNGGSDVGGFVGYNVLSNLVEGSGVIGPGNSSSGIVHGGDGTSTGGFIGTNDGGTIQGGTFVSQPGQPSNGIGRTSILGSGDGDVTAPTDPAAARANAAAVDERNTQASRTANVVTSESEKLDQRSRSAPSSSAGGSKAVAVAAAAAGDVDDKMTIDEAPLPAPRVEKPKRVKPQAVASHHKASAGASGGGFGARIRSIDVDGQHYELNGGPAAPKNQ